MYLSHVRQVLLNIVFNEICSKHMKSNLCYDHDYYLFHNLSNNNFYWKEVTFYYNRYWESQIFSY